MQKRNETIWDVAVVGGGPAGMMAAGRAAKCGAKVILIEKNHTLGKKLLMTGGGRCNLTNAEFDIGIFLSNFKKAGKFLFSALSQWGVEETLDFFHKRSVPTKTEEENRVFPKSDKAQSVLNALTDYMKEGGVMVVSGSAASGFARKENAIEAIKLENGRQIRARTFILATGGKSRPETGSTGDGFVWLKNLGHKIIIPDSALVPVTVKEQWVKNLSGVSVPDVKIALFQNGKKQGAREGKILFTHFGVSGPVVLNMSKNIGDLLKQGEVVLSLDLFPTKDEVGLDILLQEEFKKQSNKKIKNSFGALLPSALVPTITNLAGVNPDAFCHSITRLQRLTLGRLLKDLRINASGLLGPEKAVITSGGAAPEEVDFKHMRSRLFHNLYLVGDVLDIDRPSGGYSLQLCWTTGFVAGNSAAASLK